MDEDEFDAAGWAEMQLQERHRREDETADRYRELADHIWREWREFQNWMAASWRRIDRRDPF